MTPASFNFRPLALPGDRPWRTTIRDQGYLLALILVPPLAAIAFLWLTSPNDISFFQAFAAYIISCMTWGSYRMWRSTGKTSVPLFAMIAFMYWLYYVFPLFWGDRLSVSTAGEEVSSQALTAAMMMSALGVISIWLGIRSGLGNRLCPKNLPDIVSNRTGGTYLWVLLMLGCLAGLFEIPMTVFGEELGQVVYTLLAIVPLVPFAILFRQQLREKSSSAHKILIGLFLVVYSIIAISSGWLGILVYLFITCAAVFIAEKKRVPRLAVLFVIVYLLFFQVGKASLREKYWYGQESGTKIGRIAFWVSESLDKWDEAVSDPTGDSMRAVVYQSFSRVSLLTQTANVVELTPSTVPFQYGRLYSYMAVALIPRFVWPNKPSANEANQFYQVSYGLTSEDDLSHSSFGAGLLAESYINFSWFGVVGMMFLFGIFLDFFQSVFLSFKSGVLMSSIGVVLLPYLLSIEFQLAGYLGATFQRVSLVILAMLPIISFRKVNGNPRV